MNSKVDFAAGGIVLVDKKVLLVKNRLRSEYKKHYNSGFWGFPKGHLEDGETPLKAAEREVLEETGFEVVCVGEKPIAESRYTIEYGKTIEKTVWFYEMRVLNEFKKEPDHEIEEIALVSKKQALSLLTYEEDRKILEYVFNR